MYNNNNNHKSYGTYHQDYYQNQPQYQHQNQTPLYNHNTNNYMSHNHNHNFYQNNQYRYSTTNKFDYSFKFILVGDTGVGKTSIISRFIDGQFQPHHDYTIGVQYGSKNIAIANKTIKLQIWDTAGQEQFKAITRSYYRSSAAALVVFDLTRKETFRSVVRWVEDVKNNSNKDVFLVLIGNKNDLVQQRTVSRNQAVKLAKDYEMLYMQTSAKNQQNIQRAFVWPATNILDKVEQGFIQVNRQDQAIKINPRIDNRPPQDKQCSC